MDDIADPFERRALSVAYDCVINEPGMLQWFRTYDPSPNHRGSYILDDHPNTARMSYLLDAAGEQHSGASFGWVMQSLRRIVRAQN